VHRFLNETEGKST